MSFEELCISYSIMILEMRELLPWCFPFVVIVFTYPCTFCLSTGGNSCVADFESVWVQVSTVEGLELDMSATLLIVTGVLWVFVIPKFSLGSSPDFNCFTKPVFLVCQVNCSFWKCRLHIFCWWYPESIMFCRFVSRNLLLRCKYSGARLGGIEWKVTPELWELVLEDKHVLIRQLCVLYYFFSHNFIIKYGWCGVCRPISISNIHIVGILHSIVIVFGCLD